MDPVAALLRQIAYYKDRAREDTRRVMAYRNAADIVEGLDDTERERHGQANSWQSLPGIGPKTAKVIAQAWSGREPDALVELRSAAEDLGGGEIRAALRGDLHLHSNWSDGSARHRGDDGHRRVVGPRILCADRPFATFDDRQRAVAGATAQTARRHRPAAGPVRADADPDRHRGGHPRRRQPRSGAGAAGTPGHRGGQRALQAVDGFARR